MLATRLYGLVLVLSLAVLAAGEMLPGSEIRGARTAAVLFLAIASVLFAAISLPGVVSGKRAKRRSGEVELEPDETVEIDPVEGGREMDKLHLTREAAIAFLVQQVGLHCSRCGTPWTPELLGRVGKRILVERGNPAANIGEGWWSRPANAPPCATCHSTDLVPD
jgi:hypothetical protein